MKRSLLSIVLAGVVAGFILLPDAAEARYGRGGAFIGGLAAGALIGGILAAPAYGYPHYYPPYAYPPYAYGPVYYEYPPRCFRRIERRWNGYRWYRARVLVCY